MAQYDPSGTHANIHAKEGLNIKSISHLYKETHAISNATTRLNADTQLNVALDTRLEYEIKWTNNKLGHSEKRKPVAPGYRLCPRWISVCNTSLEDHKKNTNDEFQDMWHNHVKTLLVKERFLDLINVQESFNTWCSFIYNIPPWCSVICYQWIYWHFSNQR